jgi:acyl transferase domain-containing protein
VPPNVVQQTDTSQLLGLIVAQQVLEDAAGGDFQHIDKSRISVILGATGATELVVHLGSRLQRPIWLNALRANGVPEDEAQAICDRIADSYVPWTEASFPGLLGNVVAGRIANKFDLGGTNCVVDAACASSLSALAMGLSELYLRQSDMVIVGGVDTLNDILMYMCFSKTPALSASGDCRPFSDQADGTILGEGLGMLALRRLEDAERDGDPIYAVIRGIGSSSDGAGTAVYAPKSSGQAHALRRAYAAAGYSPRTVELLEAHGTATKAGDAANSPGLQRLRRGRPGQQTVVRHRLGQIADRPHQRRGRRGLADQSGAWRCITKCCRPPSKSPAPTPISASRTARSTSTRRCAPGFAT